MLCSHRLCLLSLVCMIGSLTAAGAVTSTDRASAAVGRVRFADCRPFRCVQVLLLLMEAGRSSSSSSSLSSTCPGGSGGLGAPRVACLERTPNQPLPPCSTHAHRRALLFEQAVPIMDAFPGAGTPGAYGGGMPAIAQPEEAPMGDYEPLAPEPQPVPVQDDGTTVLPAVSEANRRVELSGSASATSEAEASAGPRLASASVATPQVAWWSGGQVAGLVLGVAAASGVAAAVIVGLRRRRPAASSRYSAGCGHEVEMLGLI
jgi:hypothetical protein